VNLGNTNAERMRGMRGMLGMLEMCVLGKPGNVRVGKQRTDGMLIMLGTLGRGGNENIAIRHRMLVWIHE
jgi:hypothetical protein